jgi:uncharacterized protein
MHLLHIFIKNPRLGYVKTRLAATVGNEEALRIYHVLLEKTRSAALLHGGARWLWYSDELPENDDWAATDFTKKVQYPGDLGERMSHAFREGFSAGATAAVIVGSDCPELSPAILSEAFSALDTHDFTVGPTPDGGYYLLGMRTYQPAVFEHIAWSTEAVFPATLERVEALGATVHLLPILSDVDNEADWNAYLNR